jgi:hypothetical protein
MNFYKEILFHINIYSKNSRKEEEYSILNHLIEILGENDFNEKFKIYFLNGKDHNENFYDFHKSMRQTYFFKIGKGHLDMIFWNFIHISDVPNYVLETFVKSIKENEN